MSPDHLRRLNLKHGFPRVSGDEPLGSIPGRAAKRFSPRERG